MASQDPLSLATAYLRAREATMQEKAGPADVDAALALCLPTLSYEHPRVGIRMTGADQVRGGMVNFLGTSRGASIKITDSIVGAGMVAVQTDVAFEARADGGWTPVKRTQVWVFELEGSKIKRIIEYW